METEPEEDSPQDPHHQTQQCHHPNNYNLSAESISYDDDDNEDGEDGSSKTDQGFHHVAVADTAESLSLDYVVQRPEESTETDDVVGFDITLPPELKLEPISAYDDYDEDENDNLDDITQDQDQEPEPEEDPEPDIVDCGNNDEGVLLPGEIAQVKRRKSYANAFKLEAIKLAETIGNRKAAKQLGLDESNVREWRKRKEEIQSLPSQKRTKRHAKPRWIDLEQNLAQWYLDRKSKNLYVTINMVKEKGMELALQYGHVDFTGSSGWVTRFMSRLKDNGGNFDNYSSSNGQLQQQNSKAHNHNQLQTSSSLLLNQQQSNHNNIPIIYTERVIAFRTFFAEKRAQSELKRRNGIITIDEVPIALDMPCCGENSYSTTTTADEALHNHHQGHQDSLIPPPEKIKLTVLLSASAAGGKITPMVIFKSKSLPKELTTSSYCISPDKLIIRCNDRGWINGNLFEDWIESCWKKWLWPQRSEENLLILDSCRGHLGADVKFKCSKHFHLQYIPLGLGHLLHPMEISITKLFRESIFKQWENFILDRALDSNNVNCGSTTRITSSSISSTVGSSRPGPDSFSRNRLENYLIICNWIVDAWKDISSNVIMNGFAKAGIESFSPEDIVEAILSEEDPSSSTSSGGGGVKGHDTTTTAMLFPDQVNLVGDQFDGWN